MLRNNLIDKLAEVRERLRLLRVIQDAVGVFDAIRNAKRLTSYLESKLPDFSVSIYKSHDWIQLTHKNNSNKMELISIRQDNCKADLTAKILLCHNQIDEYLELLQDEKLDTAQEILDNFQYALSAFEGLGKYKNYINKELRERIRTAV